MASGSPDWWIRTKTDIVAQTLEELNIDIIAQTLANLNVDIIAQTLANLKVDINAQSLAQVDIDIIAQTLANLNIDIIAQTLANLKIDINAQTLAQVNIDIIAQTLANLKVDINAQTIGNLAVDLNAQTIGNLAIDINAQTIDNLTFDIVKQTLSFLTVRPAYGSAITSEGAAALANDSDTQLFYIEGQGVIYDGYIKMSLLTDPADGYVELKVDGNRIVYFSYEEMMSNAFIEQANFRYSVNLYNPTDKLYGLLINAPITFEDSFELKVYQNCGIAIVRYYHITYALTP